MLRWSDGECQVVESDAEPGPYAHEFMLDIAGPPAATAVLC
jgi:hypothetical protein